jgi:hypothetical protein
MIKVIINHGTHAATFETLELANEWIANLEAKPRPWSYKPNRWLTPDQFQEETIEQATETREVSSSDGFSVIEYFFPKEYQIEIIDLSQDPTWVMEEKIKRVKSKGSNSKYLSEEIGEFIAGWIEENSIPENQIDQFEQKFDGVFKFLGMLRSKKAKAEFLKVAPTGSFNQEQG